MTTKQASYRPHTRQIWAYWETPPGRAKPTHIELAHRALEKNRGEDIEFHLVGPEDLQALDLELHKGWSNLEDPAHRADYLRVALLHKYGGLWVDSDTITIRPFSKIAALLDEYDFVAWEYRSGTRGNVMTYRVPIGYFGVRPGALLTRRWLDEMHRVLDSSSKTLFEEWHTLGRKIMNPLLRELVESNQMTYYAIPAERSTIPIKAKQRDQFYEQAPISRYIKEDPLQSHITYFNSWMPELGNLSETDLLSGKDVICKLFQYSLHPERRAELMAESEVTFVPRSEFDAFANRARKREDDLLRRLKKLEAQASLSKGAGSPAGKKLRKLVRNPRLFLSDFASKRFGRSSPSGAGQESSEKSDGNRTMSAVEQRFTGIFEDRRWGSKAAKEETVSGNGSTLKYTAHIRQEFPQLFESLGITHVLDAPCGDFNWFREIQWRQPINYLGADVVREIVRKNQDSYTTEARRFVQLDIISDELPDMGPDSTWLCRDCLFHLSNNHIFEVLNNFAESKFKYLLTSTHTEHGENTDIKTGGFRMLNLEHAPFNLPEPRLLLKDWIEPYRVRFLGLWTRGEIRKSLEEAGQLRHSSQK